MATQFIINDKGERTAAIVPINEYEDMLHQHHVDLEVSDEYKKMIDKMLDDDANGQARFVSADSIRTRFMNK